MGEKILGNLSNQFSRISWRQDGQYGFLVNQRFNAVSLKTCPQCFILQRVSPSVKDSRVIGQVPGSESFGIEYINVSVALTIFSLDGRMEEKVY